MVTADKTPPSADETAEYAERLLAALTRFLGNEDSARTVRETTLEQARVGNALRGVSEEVLEGYLKRVCEPRGWVEERLVVQSPSTRRNASLSTRTSQATSVVESTIRECYGEFSEELLAEYHANVQMMAEQRRELKAAEERSEAAARVASSFEQQKLDESNKARAAEMKLAGGLAAWRLGSLPACLAGWLAGWLAGSLAGWLAG